MGEEFVLDEVKAPRFFPIIASPRDVKSLFLYTIPWHKVESFTLNKTKGASFRFIIRNARTSDDHSKKDEGLERHQR